MCVQYLHCCPQCVPYLHSAGGPVSEQPGIAGPDRTGLGLGQQGGTGTPLVMGLLEDGPEAHGLTCGDQGY